MNVETSTVIDRPVSVAMATYNGGKYLEEQLDSILCQTHPPSEIWVSDDQSSDDTVEILERYRLKGRLSYVVNEHRLGYVGNFKKAVSLTSPDNYVSLSDQDDVWLPEKIAMAMQQLLKLDADKPAMVYSDLMLVDENKKLINESFRSELGQDKYMHCLETLLFGGFVNGCTMVMNPLMRTYFDTIPEGEFITHDTWMALIAYTFGSAGQIDTSSILYRKHGHNATDLLSLKKQSRFDRLKSEILSAVSGHKLFERELSCAAEFYRHFYDKIEPGQQKTIERFLDLKERSYLTRKITLQLFFRGKWIR